MKHALAMLATSACGSSRQLVRASLKRPLLFLAAAVLHMALCVCYALIIVPIVHRLRPEMAILGGAVVGFGLYLLNLGAVYYLFHWAYGREPAVIVAHLLFGAFAAGAYRGLASRGTRVADASPPPPGP